MLAPQRHDMPRPGSAESPTVSINAMSLAKKVAAEYEEWETSQRDGLYHLFGRSLLSYQKFLRDPVGYEELLKLEYIARLREKPNVEETSRLVLYMHTKAWTPEKRATAARYARVVDYLHQQRVSSADAAEYVRRAGGMDAILKLARGHEAPKDADGDEIVQEDQEVDQEEDGDNEQLEELNLNEVIGADSNTSINLDTDVVITLKKELLSQIVGDDIPVNKQFVLACKKTSVDRNGRVRIVGKLWKPRRG